MTTPPGFPKTFEEMRELLARLTDDHLEQVIRRTNLAIMTFDDVDFMTMRGPLIAFADVLRREVERRYPRQKEPCST